MDSLNAQKTYLVPCSESVIVNHGQGVKAERESDLEQIVMVRLKHLLLKNVENLAFCRSLRICILANNFITKINALIECIHLVKLDLKGNQITQLPGVVFWDRLRKLQLLNLHDNTMATRKNIQGLAACQTLAALTLYDTPLSLKGNYRHCIANSILSLKALDNYVISDEEIIENWCLPFRFKSLKPHFYVNLYPMSKMGSYQSEMQTVHEMISAINRIQSLHSPTLIIQRYIRGYLTRKRLGHVSVVPCQKKIEIHLSAIPSVETSGELTERSEEYQGESCVKECLVDKQAQRLEEQDMKIQRLFVNLEGLVQTDSPELLPEVTSLALLEARKQKDLGPPNTPQHNKITEPSRPNHIDRECQDDVSEEEHRKMTFLVHGLKALFHLAEPVSDMLLSRRQGGLDVRNAIRHFHSQQAEPARPPRPRSPAINAEKRLIGRCHGSLSMAPFKMTERAFLRREQAEARRSRTEHVALCQARREGAQGQRLGLMDACRKEVLQEKEREQARMKRDLARLKASRDGEVLAARQRYAGFVEEKRRRASERALARAFGEHVTSLTSWEWQCAARQKRRDLVDRCRMKAQSQKKLLADRKQCGKEGAITSCVNRDTYLATKHNSLSSSSRPRPV